MKPPLGCGIAAIALMLTGCGDEAATNQAGGGDAPIAQIQAPNGDWTQTVTQTQAGGYLMGNPNAPVKLVEYGSFTCGHCAKFSEEATEPLQTRYVKSGQVSWEFRPFLLFPSDPGIGMLMRCQAPTAFFTLTDQLYATQSEWIKQVQQVAEQQGEQIQSMPAAQRAAYVVQAAGLDQFFRQRGLPEARVNACLNDSSHLQALTDTTSLGVNEGVTGTPSFFINGDKVEAGTWADLEPEIKKAL
jgi:protein-disulfide isomerase